MQMKNKTLLLALSGIMAALIFVSTMFLQIPAGRGYIHPGDALILLAAALLGAPAIPAAAIGSALADLFSGYTVYCLPTLIVKGAMAAIVFLGLKKGQAVLFRTFLFFLLAECWMVLGYFLAEWLVLGYGLYGASASVLSNLTQGAGGIILAALLYPPLKKMLAHLS